MRGAPDPRHGLDTVGDPVAEREQWLAAHAAHHVPETVRAIRERTALVPRLAIVLGSGLGGVADAVENATAFATTDLPHWPRSTVTGHAGRLVLGTWRGVRLAVLAGRIHFYEGYGLDQVTFPVRVFHALGARVLVLTNAVGAIRRGLSPGSLVLVKDQLNFHGTRGLFLPGELAEAGERGPFGPRPVYAPRLQDVLRRSARAVAMPLPEGILQGGPGPSYETAAEVRAADAWGADCACMSTVTEALVGAGLGLEVAALSCVTNAATGLTDQPLTHDEVTEVADRAASSLTRLFERALPELAG
ncbi:MAG TPA: purine-nucleoside phosphorylase [Candidatus Eisenbacteria bacterium]|nr:purine-nucleoside phosphorylase [Candidatus Eisenbacteria bacterium]